MAAGGFDVRVEGVPQLVAALHAFEAGVQAIKETTGPRAVADEARKRVPVRTGALRSTIEAGPNVIEAGGTLPYARVIHFGWPRHNIQPQPFLYEASAARIGDVTSAWNADIKNLARGAGLNAL